MKRKRLLHPLLNLGVVCVIFTMSVVLRWDYINRPLTNHHHTWLSGHVLLTLDIWNEEGACKFNYTPVYTYNNPGDLYNNQLGGMPDSTGRHYYVSYPPFCFIAPYAVMKATGSSPSGNFITWFNLMISLGCCIFILLIVYEVFNRDWRTEIVWVAHLGTIVYLFTPVSLWFHANVYFADMLVQLLWIAGIYFMIRYLKSSRLIYAGILVLLVFLATYTEWLGLFAGGIISLIVLIHQSNRQGVYVYLACTGAIILALGMFFYQYSGIDDFGALFKTLSDKYAVRSGMGETEEQFKVSTGLGWKRFNEVYNYGHEPLLKLFGWVAGLSTILWIAARNFKVNRWLIYVALLVVLPIAVHHVVFFNFTTSHDFSTLKGTTLLAVGVALSGVVVLHSLDTLLKKPVVRWIGLTLLLLTTGFYASMGFGQFEEINRAVLTTDDCRPLAQFINAHTKPQQGIAVGPWRANPQTSFLAKRNIISMNDGNDAANWFTVFGIQEGVYIHHVTDTTYTIQTVLPLSEPEPAPAQ